MAGSLECDGLFAVMWDACRTVALHVVHGQDCERDEYLSGHPANSAVTGDHV